jgi:hypothetical protein
MTELQQHNIPDRDETLRQRSYESHGSVNSEIIEGEIEASQRWEPALSTSTPCKPPCFLISDRIAAESKAKARDSPPLHLQRLVLLAVERLFRLL